MYSQTLTLMFLSYESGPIICGGDFVVYVLHHQSSHCGPLSRRRDTVVLEGRILACCYPNVQGYANTPSTAQGLRSRHMFVSRDGIFPYYHPDVYIL